MPSRRFEYPVALLQGAVAIVCLATLICWPSGNAELLLVPAIDRLAPTINLALAHGARIVGVGPFGWSVRISGDSSALVGPMLRRGTLVIHIPPALCGDVRTPRAAEV